MLVIKVAMPRSAHSEVKGRAIYTVIHTIYTVSALYFPTLFSIQNTGYLHCSHGAAFRGCLHLSHPAYTYPRILSFPAIIPLSRYLCYPNALNHRSR